jgi:hypothetical protein
LLKSKQKKQDAGAGGKENVCVCSFASSFLIKSPFRFLKLLLPFLWLWTPLRLQHLQPQIQNQKQRRQTRWVYYAIFFHLVNLLQPKPKEKEKEPKAKKASTSTAKAKDAPASVPVRGPRRPERSNL